ncbi:MAG: VWA domain-containing protein [Acidobacteria bacterium]|nr:VWA domain-containing protein [Acidobacteriota bacterium]
MAAVTICLLAVQSSGLLRGESTPRTATTETSAVTVDVGVERKGEAVPGLTARNFRVYENGAPRDVTRAEPAGPASIVLLVENSSHSWRFLNDVRSAMRGFLRAAQDGKGHSYALVTYSSKPVVEQSLTTEIDRIRRAFVDVDQSAWGRTDTYDAVYRVIEEMEALPGRKVLIFIGFGYDAFSRHTFGELQRKLEVANVQAYAIATGSDLRREPHSCQGTVQSPDLRSGETLVYMLARRSGGKSFCPNCEAGFVDSMRDTMEQLEHQYTIEYRRPTSAQAGFQKLKVEAFELVDDVRTDFRVRAREGWRIEGGER